MLYSFEIKNLMTSISSILECPVFSILHFSHQVLRPHFWCHLHKNPCFANVDTFSILCRTNYDPSTMFRELSSQVCCLPTRAATYSKGDFCTSGILLYSGYSTVLCCFFFWSTPTISIDVADIRQLWKKHFLVFWWFSGKFWLSKIRLRWICWRKCQFLPKVQMTSTRSELRLDMKWAVNQSKPKKLKSSCTVLLQLSATTFKRAHPQQPLIKISLGNDKSQPPPYLRYGHRAHRRLLAKRLQRFGLWCWRAMAGWKNKR